MRAHATVFIFIWAGLVAAQADTAIQDRALIDALKEVHNRAAELHNKGDSPGGYRTFQGGLIVARAMLSHRPELQTLIDSGRTDAESKRDAGERCIALHNLIDTLRNKLKTAPAAKPGAPTISPASSPPPVPVPAALPAPGMDLPLTPPPLSSPVPVPVPNAPAPSTTEAAIPSFPVASPQTLWQRLGGEPAIEALVADFVGSIKDDPQVNLSRNGRFPVTEESIAALQRKLVGHLSALTDGTVPYTGRPLDEAHADLNVLDGEFDAMMTTFRRVLTRRNVPADDAQR